MNADLDEVLSKQDYEAIRARLSFRANAWLNLGTMLMHASLLALALYLLGRPSRIAYVAAELILPIVFFQGFSLLHDCGHGSCASSRLANTLIGHYASLFCFMPYFPWKYIHTEHHVWAGNVDRDPGLALVKRARDTGKLPGVLRHAWRGWFPLGGFAQHVVYWSYPLVAYRRKTLSGPRLARCLGSVALLAVWYATLIVCFPKLISLRHFAPAIFLYLMLVELVNIPHHVGLTSFQERLPLWRQHLSTRSCNYPPVVSELLVLNFNFHIEHHLFPDLPWYRLRRARRFVKQAMGAQYREARGLAWHVERRRRDFVEVLVTRETRDPKPT